MEKKYLSVYEKIRDDIEKERIKRGEKLPSKRVCAESMNVSVITVEHAYDLLAEEGYIQAKEKSGYYVIYSKDAVFSAPSKTEFKISPLDVNNTEPVDFSFSIYAHTVRKVLTDYGEGVLEKSPGKGNLYLREAIRDYLYRSRDTEVSTEQIVVGAGAEYLYGLIVQTFGRDVIYGIESPSYAKISDVYGADGADIEYLKLGTDGIDSKELWSSHCNVLHITPYRSFPSGVTASVSKKREYLKWCVEKNAYIVEDDFESEFTKSKKPEDTLFSLDESDRVIYVNTFTKTVSPSVRAAYMLIPEKLVPLFDEKVGFYSCPVPTLEQLIIATLIGNGDFERHINRVRRRNRNEEK